MLDEDDAAAGRVVAGAYEGPDALVERRAGGGVDGRVLAVGEVEAKVAVGPDDQGEALWGGVVGPASYEALEAGGGVVGKTQAVTVKLASASSASSAGWLGTWT